MEDLNGWVTSAASWLTVLGAAFKALKWLLPKISENLKMRRSCRRKH